MTESLPGKGRRFASNRQPLESHPLHIVEASPSGHRLMYVRLLAQHALRNARPVTLVTTRRVLESSEFNIHLQSVLDDISIQVAPRDAIRLEDLRGLHSSDSPFHYVIPDGDQYLSPVALRGWFMRHRITLLLMRPPRFSRRQGCGPTLRSLGKMLLMVAVQWQPRVRVRKLASALRGETREGWIADPVELVSTHSEVVKLRQDHGLDAGVYWFAVLGNITERKNLRLVLQAMYNLRDHTVGLLVAGQLDAQSRLAMDDFQGCFLTTAEVIAVDRPLTDVELDGLIQAVDCLIVAHSNEGPSGLTVKAAAAGTRVLAAGAKSLREEAQAFPSLMTWTELEVDALTESMILASRELRPHPVIDSSTSGFTSGLID